MSWLCYLLVMCGHDTAAACMPVEATSRECLQIPPALPIGRDVAEGWLARMLGTRATAASEACRLQWVVGAVHCTPAATEERRFCALALKCRFVHGRHQLMAALLQQCDGQGNPMHLDKRLWNLDGQQMACEQQRPDPIVLYARVLKCAPRCFSPGPHRLISPVV